MGREWYWSRSVRRGERESPGCMGNVLHLFDFHQFSSTQPSYGSQSMLEDLTFLKGVEAPRNSLEMEEDPFMGAAAAATAASLSSTVNKEEENIPIKIRVAPKTAEVGAAAQKDDGCSTAMQGTKTPNLVARLMGLDLLPDQVSSSPIHRQPSPSHSKSHRHLQEQQSNGLKRELRSRQTRNIATETRYETGSRSLPDTPRTSSARRSDADPRLSLQYNKENFVTAEFNYSPCSSTKARKREWKNQEENRSPSHYAREIVKQVKESVSRKVGFDITNITTTKNISCRDINDDGLTIKFKKNKPQLTKIREEDAGQSKHSTPSCSPRLRFSEPKSSKSMGTSVTEDKPSPKPRPSSKLSSWVRDSKVTATKCKKVSCERFTERIKKPPLTAEISRNIRDEYFVRASAAKKCKALAITSFAAVKNEVKEPPTSHTYQVTTQGTTPRKPAPQLLISTTQPHKQPEQLDDRENSTTGTEFRYVTEILRRTGIENKTVVSFTKWYSPAQPVDPSVFHHLEHSFHFAGPLRHRCNRKLLFRLVDEVLRDILKPYLNLKPWLHPNEPRGLTGSSLMRRVRSEIRRFQWPSADMDAIIEKDILDANLRTAAYNSSPLAEESEWIAFEIERDILDSLVHETAVTLATSSADPYRKLRNDEHGICQASHGRSRDEMPFACEVIGWCTTDCACHM